MSGIWDSIVAFPRNFFYTPSAAWLAFLIIPLIIFYFLKLKRPRFDVSSLALWQRVINDQRVNSPFQKFRRNILLLLQLLIMIALVLAAMQPYVNSGTEQVENLPVLIDCSASMAALDEPGGTSRLDAAKKEVRKLIDELAPGQELSLITFHSNARRRTDFTDNKRVLRAALDQITVSDVPSKIEEALRMTQALARTERIEKVLMFSDGNFPEQVDFEMSFDLDYQRLPAAGANIGITALNARRSGASNAEGAGTTWKWEVFARVESSGAAEGTVELLQDGKLAAAREPFSLEPGQSQRLEFAVEADSAASLELRLVPDGFDALEADNVAYLDLPVGRPMTVFCPSSLESFRHALEALKGLEVYPNASGDAGPGTYDLMFTDRVEDWDVEARLSLTVGMVPENLQKLLTVETGSAEVVDWQRSSPILQYVELTDVQTVDQPQFAEGVTDGDVEEAGYEILAFGRTGPLVLQSRRGERVGYHFLFHTDRSTLPWRVGFPILIHNAAQLAMQAASLSEVRGNKTGVLPPRTMLSKRTYRISGPGDTTRDITSDENGVVSGISAPLVGQYELSEGGKKRASLGASLLNARETALAGFDTIKFKELSVQASMEAIKSDRPLWSWVAFFGFVVLLVEWWFFVRRPGGVVA